MTAQKNRLVSWITGQLIPFVYIIKLKKFKLISSSKSKCSPPTCWGLVQDKLQTMVKFLAENFQSSTQHQFAPEYNYSISLIFDPFSSSYLFFKHACVNILNCDIGRRSINFCRFQYHQNSLIPVLWPSYKDIQ